MVSMTDLVMSELAALRGFHEFESTTDPSAALAQDYKFKLTLNGAVFNSGNDITVTLTAGEALSSIATKIQTAINAITASSVTVAVNTTTGKIRVTSNNAVQLTSAVSLLAGSSVSLLTLLGGVGTAVTMPQIMDGVIINETKTLPGIIVTSADHRYKLASCNMTANIKTTPFNCRVYASSKLYAELLAGEVRRIVDAKTLAGGWWHIENIFYERGNIGTTVANCYGDQTVFTTTPAWS